jgi:hypothetical protein
VEVRAGWLWRVRPLNVEVKLEVIAKTKSTYFTLLNNYMTVLKVPEKIRSTRAIW